jgi:hypothetical protein
MKLKDVYITWKNGEVEVVAKSDGIPKGADNYIDPDLWDQSDLPRLFSQWFAALACGHYNLPTVNDPQSLYDELCSLDEFDKLIGEEKLLQKSYQLGSSYIGDREFTDKEFEEHVKRKAETNAAA